MCEYFEIKKGILFLLFLLGFAFTGKAQEEINIYEIPEGADILFVESTDSTVQSVMIIADSLAMSNNIQIKVGKKKHNPTKAILYSAIFPGLGQMYNQKYWKLPLVYGSFVGCMYAVTWNNRNYSDYSQAYFQVMQENPMDYKEWQNFIMEPNLTEAAKEAMAKNPTFQNRLKSRKDYFRRYRDLSIFITVGAYFLWMIDAYVDAQLFDFDISQDLSMHIEPTISARTPYSSNAYGISCSIKF